MLASQENFKSEKKGDKDRNSLVLVERTASDSYPSREDKKANSKHRRNHSVGAVKMLDTDGGNVCSLLLVIKCDVQFVAENLQSVADTPMLLEVVIRNLQYISKITPQSITPHFKVDIIFYFQCI